MEMEAQLDPLAEEMKRQLETLASRRAFHVEAIASLDTQIELVLKFINEYSAKVSAAEDGAGQEGQPDLFTDRPKRGSKIERSQYVAKMMDEAVELIRTVGRPMTRSQLLEALQARGYSVGGGDSSKVLGTNLWRSGRFVSLKGIGYWPAEDEIPEKFSGVEVRPGASSSLKQ